MVNIFHMHFTRISHVFHTFAPASEFPWPSYMLSSGSNIIFSLTALAELVFKIFFFDLNSSFFIYFFVYFFPPLGDLGD